MTDTGGPDSEAADGGTSTASAAGDPSVPPLELDAIAFAQAVAAATELAQRLRAVAEQLAAERSKLATCEDENATLRFTLDEVTADNALIRAELESIRESRAYKVARGVSGARARIRP